MDLKPAKGSNLSSPAVHDQPERAERATQELMRQAQSWLSRANLEGDLCLARWARATIVAISHRNSGGGR